MDLEKVALEAVKIKVQEIFNKINVTTAMEGNNIVIRIELPNEIMNYNPNDDHQAHLEARANYLKNNNLKEGSIPIQGLDPQANAAAKELLGTNIQ